MADNNKDQFDIGSDFNFDAISDYETDPKAANQPATADDVDFADFATGGDDKDFSFEDKDTFGDSTADTDFGSTEFETPSDFGGDTDPFDFGGPPSPESVEMDSLQGNPDEEFGDFGSSASFDGNRDTSRPAADPFADDDDSQPYASASADDPFADDQETDEQTVQEADSAPAESSKPGIKQYAAIAAAAAFVGYIGYSQVIPMFMPQGEPAAVVADNSGLVSNPLAPTLPAQSTNVVPAPAQTGKIADLAPQPLDIQPSATAPSLNIGQPVAEAPPPTTLPPAAAPTPTPVVAATDTPTLALPAATPAPVKADPIDEFVGGADRGGLASMKDDTPVAAVVAPTSDQFAGLSSRIDEIVARIERIETRVAELAQGSTDAAPVSGGPGPIVLPASDAAPAVSTSGVIDAPLKPPIIDTAVLRGVSRDVAWIAVGKDVVEVKVGDTIPDAGVVESFQNYRGRWIAVTDKGIILPR